MTTPGSTPNRRDLRRLAMQVLYQLDVTTPKAPAAEATPAEAASAAGSLPSAVELAEALDEEHDSLPTRKKAAQLALVAWAEHEQADAQVAELAPDWPTHRQPPVDRAILRLAYFEMTSGHAPVKVAINEAVELAKQFGSEQSPPFINGVLDKLARIIDVPRPDSVAGNAQRPATEEPTDVDVWLDDAIEN